MSGGLGYNPVPPPGFHCRVAGYIPVEYQGVWRCVYARPFPFAVNWYAVGAVLCCTILLGWWMHQHANKLKGAT